MFNKPLIIEDSRHTYTSSNCKQHEGLDVIRATQKGTGEWSGYYGVKGGHLTLVGISQGIPPEKLVVHFITAGEIQKWLLPQVELPVPAHLKSKSPY